MHQTSLTTLSKSLLYPLIYTLLTLLNALYNLPSHLLPPTRTPPPRTPPPHIALSGAIAANPTALTALLTALLTRPSTPPRSITLHDPTAPLNLPHLLETLPAAVWTVADISPSRTERFVVRSARHPARQLALSVVRPGAGKGVLVRAARVLAREVGRAGETMTPDAVREWLDDDVADCMLPSEPDVVVVFPGRFGDGRSLQGFSVWQMRLTQIRFADLPIESVTAEALLEMVCSAAAAPKRFGR